jgi:predicted small metal-binding protein
VHTKYRVHAFKETPVKSMTCKELGGKCDQRLTANSWEEMVKVMTKHVMEKHPDVAKSMEKLHGEDPKKWGREMRPKWEAAPETTA